MSDRKRRQPQSPPAFRQAVEETPAIAKFYKDGLKALDEVDRNRISCKSTRDLTGSVYVEEALRDHQVRSQDRLDEPAWWDYGVGYRAKVFWIEVHPASSSHIQDVIKKHDWLKTWLKEEAPKLKELPCDFVWIASGAVNLPSGSRQRKILAEKAIKFAGQHLNLDMPPER